MWNNGGTAAVEVNWKKGILMCFIAIMTGVSGSTVSDLSFSGRENQENPDKEYVIYIGLNDKDEYHQRISDEEAQEIVNAICLEYVSGYTMQEASGAWVDESGTLTMEKTLIYSFHNADLEAVRAIMDKSLTALNQNSILIEERDSVSYYYSGTGEEQQEYDKD